MSFHCHLCNRPVEGGEDGENYHFFMHGYRYVRQNYYVPLKRIIPPEHLLIIERTIGGEIRWVKQPVEDVYNILEESFSAQLYGLNPSASRTLAERLIPKVRKWLFFFASDSEALAVFNNIYYSINIASGVDIEKHEEALDRIADLFDLPKFWTAR